MNVGIAEVCLADLGIGVRRQRGQFGVGPLQRRHLLRALRRADVQASGVSQPITMRSKST